MIPIDEPLDNETLLKMNLLLIRHNGLSLQEINLGTIAK